MCWMELVIQPAPEHSWVTREGAAPASTEDLSERAANIGLNRPAPYPWESLSCVEIKVTIVITALIFFFFFPPELYQNLCIYSAHGFSWLEMINQPKLTTLWIIPDPVTLVTSADLCLNPVYESCGYRWQIESVSEQIVSKCSLSLEMWSEPQNMHFHQ